MKNNKMKSALLALLLIASLVSGLVQSSVPVTRAKTKRKVSVTVKVDSKKVNQKTISMKKGSSKKIRLSLAPNQSGIKTKYRSGKKGIVSVSKAGTLKAKKAGTAKITLTVSGDNIRKTKLWFKVKVVRPSDSNKKADIPVTITVNGQEFKAVFYNNKTANALIEKMPMTLTMKELNGNEKYHYFDTEFPTDEKSPGKISAGDIKLYGSDCLVTFYKSHSSSYQYTSVGKIENASAFAKAVGRGNVKITFKKADTSTVAQSDIPTVTPSDTQTVLPSDVPTAAPSDTPTVMPSDTPTVEPSVPPTESPAPDTGEVSDMYEITIRVNGKTFPAKLYQTETTEALMQKLPLSITMNELNGNEKYYYFSESFPTEAQKVSQIHAGDLKLYGSSCLVLFYDSFFTSYSYTSLGYVENPEGLAEALGKGNVSVEILGFE